MRPRALILMATIAVFVACAAPRPSAAPPPASPGSDDAAIAWDRIVQDAKREGRIVVIGPQGTEARDALTQGFQAKYPEIAVEFTPLAGNQIAPKLLNELAAGQFLTDLVITGTTTALESLRPADAIVPVPPFLDGPNIRDQSVWLGGKWSFSDEAAEYNLVFSAYIKEGFVYNPNVVSAAEFKSYRDLLDPKWKGKIVVRNPTAAGGGLSHFTYFYATESLGKDYIQRFFAQDITIANDDRQILDFVAREQYPIAIGVSNILTNEFIERGLPVKLLDSAALQEGSYITAGNGSFAIVRGAPHPNALRVYLDYLLSRDGQAEWTREIGFATLRQDVAKDKVDPLLVPKPGVQYMENHGERYVKMREEVVTFLNTVLPR